MRYIGPFFRMNSLSQTEISGQLFHLSKESIKTLVLNSKCGLLAQVRASKKSSINDISILNNFSPLLCIYRKASPLFIHSKSSHGFDESSFKKEISPATNAFMTLSLLELSDYYSNYNNDNRNISSLESAYKYLAKEQLQFYSENLRNDEGLFVTKKNTSDSNLKGYSLSEKNSKFKFSDQAFMMCAFYLYSVYNSSDEQSTEYSNFANQILDLFIDYKDAIYDLSFSECTEILFALNVYYKYSKNLSAKELIIDISDFLISKFQEKDYYLNSLDDCCLFSICLMDAYKHTGIISFKDQSDEINEKLISLYNSETNIFNKITAKDKKDLKYSCNEINLYLLCIIMYSMDNDKETELKPIISGVFRKFFVNGGLLTSWPDVPTLDEVERYRNLSLRSNDMLDETYFRMSILPTPKSSGMASIFVKSLTYSKKKDSLSSSKSSFDSNKNLFNFYLIIYLLKDTVKNFMGFLSSNIKNKSNNTKNRNYDLEETNALEETFDVSSKKHDTVIAGNAINSSSNLELNDLIPNTAKKEHINEHISSEKDSNNKVEKKDVSIIETKVIEAKQTSKKECNSSSSPLKNKKSKKK